MPQISVDRLRPGVFISLSSLGWMGHPFLLSNFCLSSEKQIQALREMGIREIEWDPARSTAEPLPERPAGAPPAPEPDFTAAALRVMQDEKRARLERVREQREGLARRERQFEQQAIVAGDIFRSLLSRPQDAQRQASALVGGLVENLLGADSMVIHLVNQKSREGGLAFHALNVMALSLMVGKTLRLSEEEMRHLGLGALLHDIGKQDIPPRILRNTKRTGPEEEFYRAHVGYGIKTVSGMDLPVPVRNVIACHHEFFDGTGFPNKLAGEKIPRLARIAAIANRYDNLCNPFDLRDAKAPAEALRHIFRTESARYDAQLVQLFIKTLGVYPPGTFVALSNGGVGMVVETNPADLLHPLVMLYDGGIPRSEAMLVDLRDADVKVESALSPAKLPVETVEYLAPRGRLDYFVEGSKN